MAFSTGVMDGHGLSNKMYYEYPAKGNKDDAVLAVHFIRRYI